MIEEYDDGDRLLLSVFGVTDNALFVLLFGGDGNFRSSPQTEEDLLLLFAAAAAAKGSTFQAALENGLSVKSVVIFSVEANGAKGSLSGENGSKLSEPFFFMPLEVIVAFEAGTANGSSVCEAKGSPNATSLKGSSVNSSSA